MTILKGIPRVLSPRILYTLARMGHGDEVRRRRNARAPRAETAGACRGADSGHKGSAHGSGGERGAAEGYGASRNGGSVGARERTLRIPNQRICRMHARSAGMGKAAEGSMVRRSCWQTRTSRPSRSRRARRK